MDISITCTVLVSVELSPKTKKRRRRKSFVLCIRGGYLLNTLTEVYALYKKRLRHGGSHPTLSLLRKRSQEEYDDPLVEESSRVVSSFDIAADPMLSSLIYNPPPADVPEIQLSSSTAEANIAEESSDKFSLGRYDKKFHACCLVCKHYFVT